MSSGYRVDVTVGAYSFTATDADPKPTAGFVGVLADPLTIQRYVPDGDLAPNIQQRAEATITVLAELPTSYGFGIGDPVAITVYTQNVTGGNSVTFAGRIAELGAQPHKLGILYTLTCQDYITDLAEPIIGKVDYPLEFMLERLARVFKEVGLGPPGNVLTPSVNSIIGPRVAADAGPVPLWTHLTELLAGYVEQTLTNELGNAVSNTAQTMIELVPNITAGVLDPVTPFLLSPMWGRPFGWDGPARLPASPASPRKLTVSLADTSPATGAQILDAGHVEFAPLWTLRKGDTLSRYTVQGASLTSAWWATSDWESGLFYYSSLKAPLEVNVKTVLNADTIGEIVAINLRGNLPPSPAAAWRVGEIVWRASRTEAANWVPPKLRQLLTIARIDAVNATSHNPTGKAYLAGMVASQRFTIAKGELTVAFTLGPLVAGFDTLFPLNHPHIALFNSAGTGQLGSTTFAQLDPTDTWLDYLLLYV